MEAFVNRYGTPLVTGLFLVSAVSGVALFFHWMPKAFHGMHEWLSMVLLVPVAVHVWKNWNALLGYLRRKALLLPLAVCAAAAVAFVIPALGGAPGGNPAFRAIPLLTQARIADLAPILKTTPKVLTATLEQRGFTVASSDETLDAVAARRGVPASQVLIALLPR